MTTERQSHSILQPKVGALRQAAFQSPSSAARSVPWV